ncbi:MAG: DivIVA domain-containing protein [Bacteroidia bacterium]|nr:DivIVA domain-containing protein [Bacteroidia bacterium]MDW8088383.1 DivIVA domain-containing protein [Bacteroidia bacterium]
MLTPVEIQNQSFNRTFRGYDPDEVRSFLRQVAQEWGYLVEERQSLRQKLEQLTSEINRYKEMEALLQRTLLQAEEASQHTIQNAEKKASLIVEEARQKAEEILKAARYQKEQIEESIQSLLQRRQDILLELRSFLQLQLERLEQLAQGTLASPLGSRPSQMGGSIWASKIAERL